MNSIINNILMQAQVIVEQPSAKFEIVIAVIAVIFVGVIGYLISIDRKLSKMEKK